MLKLYYRERKESINPQLLALKKKKKITKSPILGRTLINQLINFGRALFNPPRQLWARPYQSVRQQTTTSTPGSPPHIAWGPLFLFVCTADPPSPSDQGQQRPTHPSTPFGFGGLSVLLYWPACWVAYKRKSWRAWTSVFSQ
jgi:hypothetical protein